ncbi:MAG: sigma-54 dependent transcriptional regulator [Myxococcales bacterium]
MGRVLLVDDEPAVLFALKEFAKSARHEPVLAASGKEALERLEGVDAVIADYAMPGMTGVELVGALRERDDTLPVIILTAQGSERVAVQAMKAGAYEYVTKPFDFDELSMMLDRAIEARTLRVANRRLAAEKLIGRSIVGESAPMKRLLEQVRRVAPRDITVLLRGETGTGKELFGALLHAQSRRAARPLVRFNCGAIPAELAESVLFGHVKGAFTGATAAQRGFFAQADGGTVILDEVGELPPSVQASLLRVLQEGEIQPVGSGKVEKVDVRVIACTNRDLLAETKAGRFREDLYYRLAVVELVVPPLREHAEDVPALATEFARRFGDRFGISDVRLSPALVQELSRRDWPGNVRELESAVGRLVAMSAGGEIGPQEGEAASSSPEPGAEGAPTLREQLDALERSLIAKALSDVGGNQSEAARRLGVGRTTLIDRMRKYGLGA